jgi:hypothetical protein
MKFLYIPVVIFIFSSGCEFKNEEEVFGNGCDTTNLHYSDIQPIIEANCYRCHGEQPVAPFTLVTYIDLVTAVETRSLKTAINQLPGVTPMPKYSPKIDSCSLLKVNRWIENGTPK